MKADTKRKWRWSSKSLIASSQPHKVHVVDRTMPDTHDDAADRSVVTEMSLDGCSMDDGRERSGVVARMRRHGSRFLSIVGLQRSSDVRETKQSSNPPSERDVALAIVKDAATSSNSKPSRSQALSPLGLLESSSGRKAPPLLPQSNSQTLLSPVVETEVARVKAADERWTSDVTSDKPTQPYLVPVDAHIKRKEPRLRRSRSNSGFAHQLSHKLSATFGNPTIVHRPNLRTRPSLLSKHEDPSQDPGVQTDQELSSQVSTAPSSYNYSGSVSAGDPSTGKTSLESNVVSLRSVKAPDGNENPSDAANLATAEVIAREKPLSPIQEAPAVINPTVVTVETTANAKIFFETHFNSLLGGHASPRSMRRNDLETRLGLQSMSEEQRQQERSAWAAYESEHLRQTRVLKSRTNEISKGSGSSVAIAGYDVVRILGKGSFGVVRLVRERIDTIPLPHTLSAMSSWKQSPREELNNLRATAIETLKSTLDGPRSSHRRETKASRKEVYAMKVIRKSDMIRNCQEGHLRAERDFLVASEKSRWVVPLISSFQDSTNLYLVMEYMVGGDFLGLLFRKDILKERHARWYIAEMILCVEEAHRLRWIHRDVKPDNFLIAASGHLKISDFGLAFDGHWGHDQRYFKNHRQSLMEKLGIEVKGDSQDEEEDAHRDVQTNLADILTGRRPRHEKPQVDGPSEHESILQWRNRHGKRRLAGSVVGTSQYMAPEVIRGDPYDGRCDWWSIGIILYEKCLYGFTPFVCEKREDTKAKILDNAKTLIFPDERQVDRKEKVSFEAMELINSLLQEKEHRLCSKKYRLNDYQHSRRTPGQLIARRADPHAQDYQGNYVYPDDATDIKIHSFFRRISWDRLHLTRPPFVPDVSGLDDTKYFDEEEPVSDVDDAASQSDLHDALDEQTRGAVLSTARMTQVDGAQGPEYLFLNPAASGGGGKHGADGRGGGADKVKEKKRPRDRVLRDKEVGKKVLEIRKKGAFLGYTYRRPKLVSLEEERGRQRGARCMIPSFD